MIYTDQMMREIRLNKPPSRIVSLVPSITELLYDLGLYEQIAGITKFCIHPDSVYRNKKHIGGTKKIDHQKISEINPDLIIANKEENTKEDIEILEKKYPVWISDISTLDEALRMIEMLGAVTGTVASAAKLNEEIIQQFRLIKPMASISSLYLIWNNPYMAAGKNTFIDDLMSKCGFENSLTEQNRYPALDETLLLKLSPKCILLSSEPYPFKQKHISEIRSILPDCKIELVDGEYFSWYGSRLTKAPEYFNGLINKLNHAAGTLHEN